MFTDAVTVLFNFKAEKQRLVALAIFSAIIVFGFSIIYVVGLFFLDINFALQQRRAYLGNLETVVEIAKDFDKSALKPVEDTSSVFLKGANIDVVGAQLQSWVGEVARDSGVNLQSIENLAPEKDKKQSYVGLSASIDGSWGSVLGLLLRIETAQPVLFLRSAEIQSTSYQEDLNQEPKVMAHISFVGALDISKKGQE